MQILDSLPKLAVLLAGAVLLLALNVWYVRLAWNALRDGPLPDTIAPVHLGSDDKDQRAGTALAGMMLGRMGRIREEIAATVAQLSAPLEDERTIRPQDVHGPGALQLPAGLLQPLTLEMKVAGVEVGGLLNWFHRALTADTALALTVHNEAGRAVISGAWNEGRSTLWLELTAADTSKPVPNDQIAARVAYALTQRELAARMPELQAFTESEFELLLTTLTAAARLHRQTTWGRTAEAEFGDLFVRVKPLLERAPRWQELLYFAARLADRGSRTEDALALYKQMLALPKPDEKRKVEYEVRVAALTDKVVASAKLRATQAAAAEAPGPAAVPGLPPTVAEWPLRALGVVDLAMSRPVRIGVLGGLPSAGTLPADRFEVVGGGAKTAPRGFMAEYMSTVVQTASMVAPQARFVFAGGTGGDGNYTDAQMLDELVALAEAQPDVLLITFGPLRGAVYAHVLERLTASNVLVVLAAGNESDEPVSFDGTPLAGKLLIAAAVAAKGLPAPFTQRGKSVFWAPGTQIPVRTEGDRVELRDGTAYAATLAAGVAARLRAEQPARSPVEVLKLLRDTSRPLTRGGPPVLRLDAAIAKAVG